MRTIVEGARGCGVRKPGGLYLVAPELSEPCGRLPIPLDRCPHCGGGIGPARGWTWITPSVIIPAEIHGSMMHQNACPLGTETGAHVLFSGPEHANFVEHGHRMGERAGLIWIGEKFYPTPEDFTAEAAAMGVSRRIKAVPRGFELDKTWVVLAHRKAVFHSEQELLREAMKTAQPHETISVEPGYTPGVLTVFKPTGIEYVVKGDESAEELEALEKRGIEPVKVVNP